MNQSWLELLEGTAITIAEYALVQMKTKIAYGTKFASSAARSILLQLALNVFCNKNMYMCPSMLNCTYSHLLKKELLVFDMFCCHKHNGFQLLCPKVGRFSKIPAQDTRRGAHGHD